MDKPTKLVCPLGATCRTETDDMITQCHWYTKLVGKHPQTGADMDEWGCAMRFLPILSVENSQTNRQVGASVQSLRNEVVKRQDMQMKQQQEVNRLIHPDTMRVIGGTVADS